MKKLSLLAASVVFTLFASHTMAVQVSVKDVSNVDITCDMTSPLLNIVSIKDLPIPANTKLCAGHGPAILEVRIDLEGDEKYELLGNIHVVIENNGQFFQYSDSRKPSWEPITIKGLMTTPELKASYFQFPASAFKTPPRSAKHAIPLQKFYTKGTKVYVGVRANDTAGFLEGTVKEAYVIQ